MERVQVMKQKQTQILKGVLRTAQQTNQMAIDTNVQLHGQGQKLQNMDNKLSKINNTVDKCYQTSKQMNSYWYYLKNKIKRTFGINKKPAFEQQSSSSKPSLNNYQKDLSYKTTQNQHPQKCEMQEQDNAQDAMLLEIIAKVKQTKGHCKVMGAELDRQNQLITKLDSKTDRANEKMLKVNKTMGKILNK